jgi:thymidylate kinase
MNSATPSRPGAIIAVVGCDGSGKSTLTADLLAHFRAQRPTEYLYLGQSSGNILIWVRELPLIGPAIGRYLVRRSTRAHAKDDKPASPDITTALVIYLLSRWRHHKFRRMLGLCRRGMLVITDRYPQAEVPGFYFDGPGLAITPDTKGFVRWLAIRELRLYQKMASHVPSLIIRLNVDAETAHARKPDHKLKMLRDKVRVIPTLAFNGAQILDLDGQAPYAQVLQQALKATSDILGAEPSPTALLH